MKIIVTGTDTGVGKTFVCINLGYTFKKNKIDFVIYKPFATGIIRKPTANKHTLTINYKLPITDKNLSPIEDIYLYQKYLKLQIRKNLFVHKTFNFPNAPTISSIMDKKKLNDNDFVNALKLYEKLAHQHTNIIIEGIGGLLVPLTFKKLFIDFIKFTKLPVILVTTNKLGTINHTLLSIRILKENNVKHIVVFNKIDAHKSEKENKAILSNIMRFGDLKNVVEIPYYKGGFKNLKVSQKPHFMKLLHSIHKK